MTDLHIPIASFIALLLVLQCNISNGFVPQASTAVDVEEYSNQFINNLKQLTRESKKSAENVSKMVHELGQNITRDIDELLSSKSESMLVDNFQLLKLKEHFHSTSKQFEAAFEYYKDVKHEQTYIKEALLDFAQNIIAESGWKSLRQIQQMINIDLLNKLTASDSVCKMRESQQQTFDVLLKNIRLATAQTNSDHITKVRSNVFNVYRDCAKIFKVYMEKLSREFYVCDSNTQTSGDPFIILNAFQKYLFTEDQISPGFPGQRDFCHKRCKDVNEMTNPIVCKKSTFDERIYVNNDYICQSVKGCKKLRCPETRIDDIYEVCLNPTHSSDRYQLYHPKGKSNEKGCTGYMQLLGASRRGSKYGVDNNGYCKICDCTCLDNDYYISLAPSMADYGSHMVIVGAKFELLNNTLYVKVQQAKLLPNGEVDASTYSWKLIDESGPRVKIDWDTMRQIDLSKSIVSDGQVLVGLKFSTLMVHTGHGHESRVALVVASSEYDFAKGLLKSRPTWNEARLSNKPLEVGGDRPTKNSGNLRISTNERPHHDGYVTLTTTSSALDGGQHTIPFVDKTEVNPRTLTPLSGAGLVYMGKEGSGGYIGLKLTTYNIAPHINTE